MNEFEKLLQESFSPLQRYVKYKISNKHDAEDVIQEVCLTATEKFETLKNRVSFKAWLIGIANHKINDYYRKKAKVLQLPLDSLSESALGVSRFGITEQSVVRDTLDAIGDKEKQILYLYYFKALSQDEISKQLGVPIGTVKSRLHYAKEKFKQHYPYKPTSKGATIMKKLPGILPEYKIQKSDALPFEVRHEELPGMFVIPRIGENTAFGMYDFPSRKQNGVYRLSVTAKVNLHGIDGVIIQKEYSEQTLSEKSVVYAQLTDTHCRYLGGMFCDEKGNQQITTFLDESFFDSFGIGEDNCGFPTYRVPEGKIIQTPKGLVFPTDDDISDIVGSFKVALDGKSYETVRLIDFQNGAGGGMLTEYYLDKSGRTILWRRFNKNDWASKRYGKLWTEMLPDNEQITVNGETYVHWYDCVTDYIF